MTSAALFVDVECDFSLGDSNKSDLITYIIDITGASRDPAMTDLYIHKNNARHLGMILTEFLVCIE